MTITMLRLAAPSEFTTARVFEDSLAALRANLEIIGEDVWQSLDYLLGPPGFVPPRRQIEDRFAELSERADFISIDHHGFHELPFLVASRNQVGAAVRFLVIAHAPAAYGLDWALLAALLQPGDRIFAPTMHAASTIGLMVPDLAFLVRVVGHPISPQAVPTAGPAARILYLGRLVPEKGLDELLAAVSQISGVHLDIAGALPDGRDVIQQTYVRALRAKVARLGLTPRVEFHGEVLGRGKERLIGQARCIVTPSVTLEESFGKSTAEALAAGRPAVVTRWDGLPEVLGSGGTIAEVAFDAFGVRPDIGSLEVAIRSILSEPPPPELCREEAERFNPRRVARAYSDHLKMALDEYEPGAERSDLPNHEHPAAPSTGLLSHVAPLTRFGWQEAFELVKKESDLRRWSHSAIGGRVTPGAQLRSLVFQGSRPQLERWFAGRRDPEPVAKLSKTPPSLLIGKTIAERAAACIGGLDSLPSRLSCLQYLGWIGDRRGVDAGLQQLEEQDVWSPGMHYLSVVNQLSAAGCFSAFRLAAERFDPDWWSAGAAVLIEQIAMLGLAADCSADVYDLIQQWTIDFPDDRSSGRIWLLRADCEEALGRADDARSSRMEARSLTAVPDAANPPP